MSQHSFSFDDAISVQQQTDYLRSLAENMTVETIHAEGIGQTTLLSVSTDQVGSILDAMTQGQEFPTNSSSLDSSSGFWESSSSTEVLPSSSALFVGNTSGNTAMTSGDPSCLTTTTMNSQLPHSQHAGRGGGGDTSCYGFTQSDLIRSYSRQDVSSDLAGVMPFNSGKEIDINQYLCPDVVVKFCDLENRVFEKQQSRKDKQARQRIINGKVKFLVRSERQVRRVKAWVGREENAAKLEKDANGMVEIETAFLGKVKDGGHVHVSTTVSTSCLSSVP